MTATLHGPDAGLPIIVPFGDRAVLAVFGDEIDEGLNRRARALAAAVDADRRRGGPWGAPVPGYASLLAPYDPRRAGAAEAAQLLAALAASADESLAAGPAEASAEPDPPLVEIPVAYGGADGPDLPLVARLTGLAEHRVIEIHASVTYRVFLLGFAPGFAYLGTLRPELAVPRRAEPRIRVPAGSVAIAGRQTAVYPLATPGGWQLIGRTEIRTWDPGRTRPALLRPGARVQFIPENR